MRALYARYPKHFPELVEARDRVSFPCIKMPLFKSNLVHLKKSGALSH